MQENVKKKFFRNSNKCLFRFRVFGIANNLFGVPENVGLRFKEPLKFTYIVNVYELTTQNQL